MKGKQISAKESTNMSDEEQNVSLNNKLENFLFKMRTLEVENVELKQELQSLTFRAKEEASDVS
jgi:hypothetical protein